jgi:hypothetical protein
MDIRRGRGRITLSAISGTRSVKSSIATEASHQFTPYLYTSKDLREPMRDKIEYWRIAATDFVMTIRR